MKTLKIFSLVSVILSIASFIVAAPVNQEKASLVANSFLNVEKARWQQTPETTPARFGEKAAEAAKAYAIKGVSEIKGDDGATTAYVAELNPEGFVIISADDEVEPVLGFSLQGQFPFAESGHNVLLHLVKWDTAGRGKALREAKAKGITTKQTNPATRKWETYLASKTGGFQPLTPKPLTVQQWPPAPQNGWITTAWDQGGVFDDDCPNYYYTGLPVGRCDVGCTATAMAQIINYWKYPNSASFTPSDAYTNKGYAPIRFDVDSSIYGFPTFSQLNSQLSTITYSPTNYAEQAALCFGIGIKLKMNYGVPLSIGNFFTGTYLESGAFCSDWAYKNGFSYGSAILRGGGNVWNTYVGNVIANMESGWPVQIAISTPDQSSRHSVVVDGYRTDGYFHVNVGWGGTANAWYQLPSMNTGSYNFQLVYQIVYDIAPYTGWNQVGADERNSYRTCYSGPTAASNKWSVVEPTGFNVGALVVGAANRIYASVSSTNASTNAYVLVVNQYGTVLNRIQIPDRGYSLTSPVQDSQGKIWVYGMYTFDDLHNCYLYKVDPGTLQASQFAQLPQGGNSYGNPKTDSQGYVYNTSIQSVICISSQTQWTFSVPHSASIFGWDVAVDETKDKVYVSYYNASTKTAYLGCLNRSNGQLLFEKTFSNMPSTGLSITTPSVGNDGTVYVCAATVLYALNPDNSFATLWSRDPSSGAYHLNQPPAIGADGTLYLVHLLNTNGLEYAVLRAMNPQNGSDKWVQLVTPVGAYWNSASKGYVTQGGTVYLWKYDFDQNGANLGGHLYAYQDNGSQAAYLFEHTYGTNAQISGFGPGGTMYLAVGNSIQAVSGGSASDPNGAGMGYANNQPPNVPSLIGPLDETNGLKSSVTLSWQDSDPLGHGLSYGLSVCALIPGQESVDVPMTNNLAVTSFTLTNLQPGIKYLWKVTASDGQAITESPVWAFTTQPLPQLAISKNGTNVVISWATNSTGFTLQSTTNLVAPANWNTVSPGPVVIGGQNVVTNAISGTKKFYRLSQ
jgi:hypothetical protein